MKMFDVYPVYDVDIVRAEGSYVWDNKGTKYLDMYGGHAVISIGHTNPHYVKMLTDQLNRIGFYSNSVIIDQQRELAEKLGKLSGKEDYQLFLCNSGAEANENALKLASFFNGKKKVIAMKGAFHGRTSLAVAATDNPKIQAPVIISISVLLPLPLRPIKASCSPRSSVKFMGVCKRRAGSLAIAFSSRMIGSDMYCSQILSVK